MATKVKKAAVSVAVPQSKAACAEQIKTLLEEAKRDLLASAKKTLSEEASFDTDDLPDEMDLASSEYLHSFTFRLRGREKVFLDKIEKAEQPRIFKLVNGLSERAASLNRQRWLGLGFAGLGLLAFLWAGTAFYRSTLIALHQVERVVRAGAQGDLTQHARVPGSDEFAGMAQSLSVMSRQLGGAS